MVAGTSEGAAVEALLAAAKASFTGAGDAAGLEVVARIARCKQVRGGSLWLEGFTLFPVSRKLFFFGKWTDECDAGARHSLHV